MTTIYPSIPSPSKDINSIYEVVQNLRQAVSLLIVNAQSQTNQTLTLASQKFAKRSAQDLIISNADANLANANSQINTLQNEVNMLQNQVAALQKQIAVLQGQI